MDHFYQRLLSFRYLVTLVVLGLMIWAAAGAQYLAFKDDYRIFFRKDNPQLLAFERMQKTFAKSDNALFILAPDNGDLFTRNNLEALAWLTEQSWQLPFSTRVDSVTNFQHSYAENDDLIVEDLVYDPQQLDPEQLVQIRQLALNEPLLRNRLISTDGSVTAVNVSVNLPGENLIEEVPKAAAATRELRDRFVELYPGFDVHLSGMVFMNTTFSESSINDSKTLIPLMFLAVIVLIGVLVRTLGGLVATLLVIVLSITAAMGLAGWAGFYLSGPSAAAPTIILTLAVADCVHIMTTFYHEMRRGVDQHQALINSLKINTQPVVITSVTTAVGFLCLNFSDAPPFADLGNIVAVGVMLACLLSLTLFPAVLAMMPLRAKLQQRQQNSAMDWIGHTVIRHRWPLLWLSLIVVIATVSQLPRNELNDNFVEYFDRTVPFRQAADFSDQHLTGMSMMEIELNSGQSSGINDPQFLLAADRLVQWLREQPETVHVEALTDTMKRLNRNMHGDNPEFYRLPESRELAAQYLLLYEMSLPYGLDLNNQLNVDKSAIRLRVSFHDLSSRQILALERKTHAWMAENAPQIEAVTASPPLMFAHIGMRNINSMLTGTVTALLLISVLLGIALQSVKFGFLSLAPNLIPAAIAFGVWGMLVGEIGLALSVVASMTLGIIVDDTVHFLSKYLHARRHLQLDTQQAILYAFNSVGMALWTTTVVLSVGFLILSVSSFRVNGDMGLLTAITIIIALVVDFILLPILIMLVDRAPAQQPAAVTNASNKES